ASSMTQVWRNWRTTPKTWRRSFPAGWRLRTWRRSSITSCGMTSEGRWSMSVSPGRVTALWLTLRILAKFGGVAEPTEVIAHACLSPFRGGGLPIQDGYDLARFGGFVAEGDGLCCLTDPGRAALALCDEDEPNQPVRGLLVSTLFLRRPPTWVSYWQGDPN